MALLELTSNSMEQTTISKQVETQSQDYAKRVMSMNRHERRAFAKQKGLSKIYGTNIPIINLEKQKSKLNN